ncbi:helicase-related protein [Natronococcus sp. A-GB7]|uniref:helicase-related protein n=1 Tax=Natronococcus sp. A-GB7 TaxID=3037649 RepID=UPI00241C414F|nr:helicase-related protein [Natronococcus sp. A-GB7]MDG5821618.1 helicase-related protein [Natronococcus sp. A-GB7]
MLALDPLVDNADGTLEDVYGDIIPQCEEIRIATGYFYLSGFDLIKDELDNLRDPDEMDHAPLRILMGRKTDRRTADEISEGQTLQEQFQEELEADIEELNNAQIERLDRLRDFIANGLVDVRVRDPEQGYFHAKGACFRGAVDDPSAREGDVDRRPAATIVGSSNFSQSGQRNNIELNLTSQERGDAKAFEDWYDNQWANADKFSENIVKVIENSGRYQEWQKQQEQVGESTEEKDAENELGTYLEPFEMYKLLAYDELNGNVGIRDSPLYYFQTIGYESAKEKLSKYSGCIISDSVGLGKSFIGGELLYDYRQRGDRCLLIVPANLTEQWAGLLQDDTDESGDPYFGLEVDGTHLDVMSISKFQRLSHDEVLELKDAFDVLLIDEAHRFRNHGRWKANPSHDDDYSGTRRHANLRLLRDKTMIMLTATPINNSAEDLEHLISLFTSAEELMNKASLDFDAFEQYTEKSARRKRIAADKEEASEEEERELTNQLQQHAEEISEILNEVMVLRTRKHVKETIKEDEDFEMSFKPPTLHKERYELPRAYQPIYRMLPDVMDALHLPHITIRNPKAGETLKALYKLNLLKRLESSTYAFVQSIQTLHESERSLLGFLGQFPDDENINVLREMKDNDANTTIGDFVQGEDAAEELERTLEEFGFDTGAVKGDRDGDGDLELVDVSVGEVKTYIREDLTLLAYFLSRFVSRVAEDAGAVADAEVELEQWLVDKGASVLPDVPENERNPLIYPSSDLSDADEATLDFYEAVFALREFRDPKIDRLAEVMTDHNEKVLVFTQFRATADYVYRTLIENPNSPLTETNSAVVKGGDEKKQDIIKRFAPDASGYQQTLNESDENELQYVVATDTLSEGVNLQDVHVAVNYDLPWNPMRIVQRVGRIDRIGSTAEKHVHNFFPDEDIEAAIKLLERLQAKIDDISLIVGKENNILDPNENAVLDRAGVETEKTIGELEVEEIEQSLRESRAVDDYNELDDTSKNPLLQNAGSNESDALKRYRLKLELNEEYGLDADDFTFAEDYFDDPPDGRDLIYTNAVAHDTGPRRGVFALAHLWFEDESEMEDAPLGRVRRALYYKPFNGEVNERSVRYLGIDPDTDGEPLADASDRVLSSRGEIENRLNDRLENVRGGQVGAMIDQGEDFSVEQEMILSHLTHDIIPNGEDSPAPSDEYDTFAEWGENLRKQLIMVGLAGTDEDRVLRDTFRHSDRYDKLAEWPAEEFLGKLDAFIEENIEASTEYQATLVSESAVKAEIICWGVLTR